MYISSLYAFTRFLAPEDVPYVFTFDNTGEYHPAMPSLVSLSLSMVDTFDAFSQTEGAKHNG